jgi:hypothetical protein
MHRLQTRIETMINFSSTRSWHADEFARLISILLSQYKHVRDVWRERGLSRTWRMLNHRSIGREQFPRININLREEETAPRADE